MDERDIPEEVLQALARGRSAYLHGEYRLAEAANRDALARAERLGSAEGAARAWRYLGLCAYRRGDSTGSARLLEAALVAAEALGWESEVLLIHNHLGATYRKLGRLDDADRVFRDALRRADPRRHLVARARLLGNFGAFLDELGDERAAAEYYARYEELLSLMDDPGRLANAHGLVSRAARMRGDLPTAEAKAREELRLGVTCGQPTREGRGWMHLAQALAAAGRADEAERAFGEAEHRLSTGGDRRTPIEIAVAIGRFFLDTNRIHEAHAQVGRAAAALAALDPSEHEHRARVSELAAKVASAAGLHGEALWHMGEALEGQLRRFEPISDERLRPYTQGRRRALVELARRLLEEAGSVGRGDDEDARVEDLLARLTGAPPRQEPASETVHAWRHRVRTEAELRWSRLLPGLYPGLTEQTRQDLVLADVVSEGPVGDLPRSLLLLFATFERELRARVVSPLGRVPGRPRASQLHQLLAKDRHFGLADITDALIEPASGFGEGDARVSLERRLRDPGALVALRALRAEVTRVDGRRMQAPTAWRNDVAHGRVGPASRLDGDAVRRVLTLGEGAPLGVVLGMG